MTENEDNCSRILQKDNALKKFCIFGNMKLIL